MHLFDLPLSPSGVTKPAKEKYSIWSIYPELSSSFPVVRVSKNQIASGMGGQRKSCRGDDTVSCGNSTRSFKPVNRRHLQQHRATQSRCFGVPYKPPPMLHISDIDLTCVSELDRPVAYLCFRIIKRSHVLEQTIQDALYFEQEGGSVSNA
jgi:hypothetical protein